MSYSQINFLIKAVQDKNITKMTKGPLTSWLLYPPLLGKVRGEIVNTTFFKKTLAKLLELFKQKRVFIIIPGLVYTGMTHQVRINASVQGSLVAKDVKTTPTCPVHGILSQPTFFSSQEQSQNWLALVVTGQLQDKRGCWTIAKHVLQ